MNGYFVLKLLTLLVDHRRAEPRKRWGKLRRDLSPSWIACWSLERHTMWRDIVLRLHDAKRPLPVARTRNKQQPEVSKWMDAGKTLDKSRLLRLSATICDEIMLNIQQESDVTDINLPFSSCCANSLSLFSPCTLSFFCCLVVVNNDAN